jgi:hypothetical protein
MPFHRLEQRKRMGGLECRSAAAGKLCTLARRAAAFGVDGALGVAVVPIAS